MVPVIFLQIWLLGVIALGLIGGTGYLGHEWYQEASKWDEVSQRAVFAPDFGANHETLLLAAALLLGLVVLGGRPIIRSITSLTRGATDTDTDPRFSVPSVSQERLTRPDGTELQVKFYGPEEGLAIVCTHGWSLTSEEWNYLTRDLSDRFRVIVWDLPGLGESDRPLDKDFSVDRFARDLEAVLRLADDKPAILLGHSIGGMITLKFCELFPEALGSSVVGLVLTQTTHTNPVRTASGATFLTAIEKPVLIPLMWLTIALSPIVRLLTWLSYRNGSLHLMAKQVSFAGNETWEQIDFAARFQIKASPAVLARGMLGMMQYDATPVLQSIGIPTLVVAGDKDTSTKPEASHTILEGIPDSQLVVLSPARHMGLIEHHETYSKTVREFIHATQSGR